MGRGESKQSLLSPLFSLKNLNRFSSENAFQEIPAFPFAGGIEEHSKPRYVIKDSGFVAGDIVLWDGERKVVVDGEKYSANAFPENVFTPIGVIVIPETHMDDCRARMMATRWMSCEDPENGSLTYQEMIWGTATDLTGLTNFEQVPVIARYDDESAGGVTALTDPQAIYTAHVYAFLPSNIPGWTGETNPEDEGTRWRQSNTYWRDSGETVVDANNFYAPSPYAADGTPNPLYRATSYSGGSLNNALSYFDGRHQTDVILEARGEKDYGSWKPTYNVPEDFPAVSVCDMYHTVGTNQGDWYLPSQSEMGYIVARLKDINNAMTKVNGMQALPSCWAWSSSEYSSSIARLVIFYNGRVDNWGLKEGHLDTVVAFCPV